MRSFSGSDFIAHVSRTSDESYMLVTIDPAAVYEDEEEDEADELVVGAFEGILDEKTALVLAECCAVTIAFHDLASAHAVIQAMEEAFPQMEELGVIAVVYAGGHAILSARQDGEIDPELAIAHGALLM